MTALTRFFFRLPHHAGDTWAIVRWWETRRGAYNLAVGAAGVCTLAVVALTELLPPLHRAPRFPLGLVAGYAILANLCYSLGPIADAWIVRRFGRRYDAIGPVLFRYGFVFAVGLTLLPIPVALLGFLVRAALLLF